MITRVVTDHSGRKFDLALFSTVDGPGEDELHLLGPITRGITGRNKGAQNFAREFFTPKGTWKGDPAFGGEMIAALLDGRPMRSDEIHDWFAIDSLLILERIAARARAEGWPDDEWVVSAELRDFQLDNGVLRLNIILGFRNGDVWTDFRLPIATGGMLH